MIIRSKEEVAINKWTKIHVARNFVQGVLTVDDGKAVIGRARGPTRSMYLKTVSHHSRMQFRISSITFAIISYAFLHVYVLHSNVIEIV